MKDLLSKEDFYYKIFALLMKNNAYHTFYQETHYMDYPTIFTRKYQPLYK